MIFPLLVLAVGIQLVTPTSACPSIGFKQLSSSCPTLQLSADDVYVFKSHSEVFSGSQGINLASKTNLCQTSIQGTQPTVCDYHTCKAFCVLDPTCVVLTNNRRGKCYLFTQAESQTYNGEKVKQAMGDSGFSGKTSGIITRAPKSCEQQVSENSACSGLYQAGYQNCECVRKTSVDLNACSVEQTESNDSAFGDGDQVFSCIPPSTSAPTKRPSFSPSLSPSLSPSKRPTSLPSKDPTKEPSSTPPSMSPSLSPSLSPTKIPTRLPSQNPTKEPSTTPSSVQSTTPTWVPSTIPSSVPSSSPLAPSLIPTTSSVTTSNVPTVADTTASPTTTPSKAPSGIDPGTEGSSMLIAILSASGAAAVAGFLFARHKFKSNNPFGDTKHISEKSFEAGNSWLPNPLYVVMGGLPASSDDRELFADSSSIESTSFTAGSLPSDWTSIHPSRSPSTFTGHAGKRFSVASSLRGPVESVTSIAHIDV